MASQLVLDDGGIWEKAGLALVAFVGGVGAWLSRHRPGSLRRIEDKLDAIAIERDELEQVAAVGIENQRQLMGVTVELKNLGRRVERLEERNDV